MSNIDPSTTVVLGSGSVEYALDEAAVSIDDMIESLQGAKQDGATHVVASSGNYRGAQWSRLSPHWVWADDDE